MNVHLTDERPGEELTGAGTAGERDMPLKLHQFQALAASREVQPQRVVETDLAEAELA
jgi:hypothetical protein